MTPPGRVAIDAVDDTRRDLTEAQRLYLRLGYAASAPFNDEPYADRWFTKRLG